MIVYVQDARLVTWANDKLGVCFDPKQVRTIANIADDGRILCVVVYDRFSRHGCEMSIASDSKQWCTRRFLRAAFTYPFVQCNYRRVTFVTTPTNAATISLMQRLGAKQEGRLRHWFGDEDGLVYGLLKEDCWSLYAKRVDGPALVHAA